MNIGLFDEIKETSGEESEEVEVLKKTLAEEKDPPRDEEGVTSPSESSAPGEREEVASCASSASPEASEGYGSPSGAFSFDGEAGAPLFIPEAKIKPPQDLRDFVYKEVVIDADGRPRQAGATQKEGEFIDRVRRKAEGELYFFAKGILGRVFLTKNLHLPVCRFLQRVPPARKLVLMPREHAKTAIVSGCLPLHIIIQSAEDNIYFPGLDGNECRIMLAGENMRMAKKNLRVLESVHSENRLFRALWPRKVWDEPRRQAKVWNQEALIFPRANEWPDPTIWALGVDGAVTGARPNVQIKDDLVSIAAANSEVEMDNAIEWHKASRALADTYEVESGLQSLEFIIGTRWAVYDLYSFIIDNDPSVEVIDERFHKIIRNGEILWPEKHTEATIEQLRKEHGSMFFLLYLNSAADPELTDFDLSLVRHFDIGKGEISFEADRRDEILEAKYNEEEKPVKPLKRGSLLDLGSLANKYKFFKVKGE